MFAWFGWFTLLGILLSGFSLFSLVQKFWEFGIAPIFKDLLNFYRAVFYPFADLVTGFLSWLAALAGINLPHIPSDAVVTYILIGAALCRYSLSDFTSAARHKERGEIDNRGGKIKTLSKPSSWKNPSLWKNKVIVAFYSLIWPAAIFLGLRSRRVICRFRVPEMIREGKRITKRPDSYIYVELKFRDWVNEISKVIVAFFILFIANAYFTYEQSESRRDSKSALNNNNQPFPSLR